MSVTVYMLTYSNFLLWCSSVNLLHILQLLQELESLRNEREAKAGIVVKQEGRIKVLEQALAKSKEDLQIATKLRTSLETARSKSPDLRSQRKHAANLEAKLKPLETQLVVAKVTINSLTPTYLTLPPIYPVNTYFVHTYIQYRTV